MSENKPLHPDPQFERANYECLNGTWGFSYGKIAGKENCAFDGAIRVPYCPESELSGVHTTDFIPDCAYTREIDVRKEDLDGKLWLRFGAVDYRAEVYINGKLAGSHTGGFTAFAVEITPFVTAGRNRITVAVHDDAHEKTPRGKQSDRPDSYGCFYTRVTGIWQTVWLERTPAQYIKSLRFTPDAAHGKVRIDIAVAGKARAEVAVTYNGRVAGRAAGEADGNATFDIALDEIHLWEIGAGRLYDVCVRFGDDEVKSYFGLRDVAYCGKRFTVNGKSVYQRFVLDQGYYPRGVYTPERDAQYGEDIALAQSLGFNGARLHQKVFAPRYLYECDRRGFLVWGEYASWGVAIDDVRSLETLRAEWTEAVEQMRNHPCVAAWCPLNETWEDLSDATRVRDVRLPEGMYRATKSLDPTRPCVDVSGGYHGKHTDIADFHCYESYAAIKSRLQTLAYGKADFPKMYAAGEDIGYNGEPLVLSEFGGVTFNGVKPPPSACVRETAAWGYDTAQSKEAFVADYVKTVDMLLSCAELSGFCYTQLYDVEQEQNGLFTFDRKPKLGKELMRKIAECNRRTAAIEASARENARAGAQ